MLNMAMLRNYVLITLRSLYREKVYALINIVGLALAVACCLILALYVRSELTYDQHNENFEKIYRITAEFVSNGKTDRFGVNSSAFGPLFLKEYPQVGEYVRFKPVAQTVYRYKDIEYYWDDVFLADENVFNVFSHKVIYGDLKTALVDPYSIAISNTFSRKYFGDSNPIGETINTDATGYKVTAVFEDLPDNSHLKYNAMTSMNVMPLIGQDDSNPSPNRLFGISDFTYILLSSDMSKKELKVLLEDFYNNVAAEIGTAVGLEGSYPIQHLGDIHFYPGLDFDRPTGNIFYVYGFIAVSIFILLVACINYTNLATARTIKRSKEVGMRKVIGAERYQLVLQFMGESIVYVTFALILGLLFVYLAETFTPLNSLLDKGSLLSLSAEPQILVWIVLGAIFVALLAGAYPAIYLSSISPISAISAGKGGSNSRFSLRQILVFLQFFVSVAVVACTLVMQQQIDFIASKSLGFENENKIAVMLQSVDTIQKLPLIKNELLKDTRIKDLARSTFLPGKGIGIMLQRIENSEGKMEDMTINLARVDNNFVKLMGIELIQGRDFSKRLLTDVGTSVIVNETLVNRMGWDEPLGKRIQSGIGDMRVIGVVKDFHFKSLHETVQPMFLFPYRKQEFDNLAQWQKDLMINWIVISLSGDDVFRTINTIETVISRFDGKHPFEYHFINDLLDEQYNKEINLMKLTSAFSVICIFISCLGLYGLAAFTTEQRTKEIGIRKVLGASTFQIVFMLSKNLLVMVLVAAVLASVMSYYVMDDSLNAFAYRTDISYWVFIISSVTVAIVAFLTVSLQSMRTAQSNPVESLRYE